jgi:hypothetical protein
MTPASFPDGPPDESPHRLPEAIRQIHRHFRVHPASRMTVEEAARFFALDTLTALQALDVLLDVHLLQRSDDGTFWLSANPPSRSSDFEGALSRSRAVRTR